jgi:two-component sensor histidine kinase
MAYRIRKKKAMGITLHIIAWVVLFCFPFLYSGDEAIPTDFLIRSSWLPLFWSALLFYTNYFLLIKYYIFKRKTFEYIGINLLLVVAFAFLNNVIMDFLPRPAFGFPGNPPHHDHFRPSKTPFFLQTVATLFIPLVTSLAIRTTQRWQKIESEKKEIDHQRLESELSHLKYQLQPHFFFNSLNTIYSLIDISTEKAKQGIHSLAKLMRYLLYETASDKVDLPDEIDFLRQYINVMQLRMKGDVKIASSFPEFIPHWQIAPLLFIPLIENAFKHGVSSSHPSFIHIELNINDYDVELAVENSYCPKSKIDKSGSGIGLNNLRQRLERLYPGKFLLKQEVLNEIYCSKLTINPR